MFISKWYLVLHANWMQRVSITGSFSIAAKDIASVDLKPHNSKSMWEINHIVKLYSVEEYYSRHASNNKPVQKNIIYHHKQF